MGLIVQAASAQPAQRRPAPSARTRPERSPAFGATIIDLALTVDDAARTSLTASPDTEVPARLTFKDASGADTSADALIRIKGQKGSKRPFDDKPAFKLKLGHGRRFFGLEHLTLNNMVQGLENQKDRIQSGNKDDQLTKAEATKLRANDAAIRTQEKVYRKANDGP